jgi:hypothetical protein
MKMTLREAAEAVGRNKSTVFRSIQDGKLKAERSENGLIFIDSKDLLETFPPEDSENRVHIARRGRPIGTRKKQSDGQIPETPQLALMGQEIIRLEALNNGLKNEIEILKNRFGADSLRVQDITLERERLLARITLLERTLDEVRSESASKDGRIYELKSEKDKYLLRIEKLENTLSEMASNIKEPAKKSLIEKLFA